MSNPENNAQPAAAEPQAENTKGGTPPSAAAATKSARDQIVNYLIPVIPLAILFLLFVGIILFTDYILHLTIPDATRSFIFIIFTFFACAVYLTKVLGENTSIKINGWALNGTLAIIFVVGYFAAERFQDIAGAIGFVPPAVPSVGFPLAEVALRCNTESRGSDARTTEKETITQTRRIYTFIGGDETYVEFAKSALERSESAPNPDTPTGTEHSQKEVVPVSMVQEGTPEHDFFFEEHRRSNQTAWLAYSVAARHGRIPIPTRLNVEHITAFFIEPPPTRDGAEAVADSAPGPSSVELIPVARVTILPKEIESPPRHEVTILLNVLGKNTPCWTPADPGL